jgi:hypothetical protein
LGEQRDALVLVGAQAIYLHTGDADIAVPAFATDGDLVIEPARLKEEPKLAEAMTRTSSQDCNLGVGSRRATSIRSLPESKIRMRVALGTRVCQKSCVWRGI